MSFEDASGGPDFTALVERITYDLPALRQEGITLTGLGYRPDVDRLVIRGVGITDEHRARLAELYGADRIVVERGDFRVMPC